MDDNRPQDMSYYNGEFLGYEWRQDEDGKNRLF